MEKLLVNNLLNASACIEKFYKEHRHQIFHGVGKPFSISCCVVVRYTLRAEALRSLLLRLLVSITPCISDSTDTKNAVENM